MTDHGQDRDHDTLPLPFMYVTRRPNPEPSQPPDVSEVASPSSSSSSAELCFEEDVELDPVCTLEFVLHSRGLDRHGNDDA